MSQRSASGRFFICLVSYLLVLGFWFGGASALILRAFPQLIMWRNASLSHDVCHCAGVWEAGYLVSLLRQLQ